MECKKILKIVGVALAVDFALAQIIKPKIRVVNKIPLGFNGCIFPPFGVIITEENKNNERLINHELVHWDQYKRHGAILMSLRYLLEILIFGYDKSLLEIEARKKSGETPECLEDYTACVRDGRSLTAHNPNFRKY